MRITIQSKLSNVIMEGISLARHVSRLKENRHGLTDINGHIKKTKESMDA